jgi:hypothetical protein
MRLSGREASNDCSARLGCESKAASSKLNVCFSIGELMSRGSVSSRVQTDCLEVPDSFAVSMLRKPAFLPLASPGLLHLYWDDAHGRKRLDKACRPSLTPA